MLFAFLHEQLIARVRDRIRAGEITERGLAKLTGLSQPHVHNALKGARFLSTASADLIGAHLGISIADLLESGLSQTPLPELIGSFSATAHHLAGVAGPFQSLEVESPPVGFHPLPKLSSNVVNDPVWVTLGHDPEIYPHFQDGDLALIGRTSKTFVVLDRDAVYLVNTQSGMLLRALRLAGSRLYLITPSTASEPRLWTPLPLGGRDLQEVIFGKLIWLNREIRPNPFGIAELIP